MPNLLRHTTLVGANIHSLCTGHLPDVCIRAVLLWVHEHHRGHDTLAVLPRLAGVWDVLPLTGPELLSDRVPFVFRNAPNRFRSCSVGAPKTVRESPRPSYETEQNGTKRNTFFRNRLGNHRFAQAGRDQPPVFGTGSGGTVRACRPVLAACLVSASAPQPQNDRI